MNRILELNSRKPQICITCLELISDRQTAIKTPHGVYHGAPFTCVEGRKEEDTPWYQN